MRESAKDQDDRRASVFKISVMPHRSSKLGAHCCSTHHTTRESLRELIAGVLFIWSGRAALLT
jgi:hypothetical protein